MRMAPSVLVFQTALLDRIGRFEGYSLETGKYLPVLLDPRNNHFMERDTAEQDVRYKQLIPYVVLRHGETVFQYVRGKRSSESRLRAMRSIGLGGHIEPADRNLFSSDNQLYLDAARREVDEEVALETSYVERIVALLNDETTEVGKVHFGIVHLWDLAEPNVRKREGLITQAGFTPIRSLVDEPGELETWSQLVLQVLQDSRVPPYGIALNALDSEGANRRTT